MHICRDALRAGFRPGRKPQLFPCLHSQRRQGLDRVNTVEQLQVRVRVHGGRNVGMPENGLGCTGRNAGLTEQRCGCVSQAVEVHHASRFVLDDDLAIVALAEYAGRTGVLVERARDVAGHREHAFVARWLVAEFSSPGLSPVEQLVC